MLLKVAAIWALSTSAVLAADGQYFAIAKSNAILRGAHVMTSDQLGVVPAGTPLTANVCFDEGAYCYVTGGGFEGYVAGDLLTISGDTNTVMAAEKARWTLIRSNGGSTAPEDSDAGNIVVWGDSLTYDITFAAVLEPLLPGRAISMQGVPGADGAAISARMLADTKLTGRFKVIWDRHGDGETASQYLSGLKPIIERSAETGDFIILSDIRRLIPGDTFDLTADERTTARINSELARLYPQHFVDVTGLLESLATRGGDGLHLSKVGYDAVSRVLAREISRRIR